MPEYRRNRVPGGCYFFTVALADRRSDLLVRETASLRAAVARTRHLHPFQIHAWVVLPDHMHAIWTLPEGDADYSLCWALIKRLFSAAIPPGEHRSLAAIHQAVSFLFTKPWLNLISGDIRATRDW